MTLYWQSVPAHGVTIHVPVFVTVTAIALLLIKNAVNTVNATVAIILMYKFPVPLIGLYAKKIVKTSEKIRNKKRANGAFFVFL